MSEEPVFIKVYEARRHKWRPFCYEVLFEGDVLFRLCGLGWSLPEARALAGMLNGAYNLGRANMRLQLEAAT